MITSDGFLFIEPTSAATAPVIDDITRAATALMRSATKGTARYRGWHECSCGANSDNADHYLPDGRKTHSLAVHYVACHRAEVPEPVLLWLGQQTERAEPTARELGSQGESSAPRTPRYR